MLGEDLQEINPEPSKQTYTSQNIAVGIPIPKQKRVQLFSPEEWEEFTEEWATTLKNTYHRVARSAGAGDMGLDVVGFVSSKSFEGEWDNFQCKHYDHPLTPSDIWVEIGKLIYYSYMGEYTVPRKYYFIAVRDIGTKLQRFLSNPTKLKEELLKNWAEYCEEKITSTTSVKLEGALKEYFDKFDFRIFSTISVTSILEQHSESSFHTVRFGGGLPSRPPAAIPPQEIDPTESRYIRQILDVYGDFLDVSITSHESIKSNTSLTQDFTRQRERFYHAESLRNFSRDTVPNGTFESLQDDIYYGVVDTCNNSYPKALDRMKSVMTQSANLELSSNPLLTVLRTIDKQGICHQLANTDRLNWMGSYDE